jgi:hypothetical protein
MTPTDRARRYGEETQRLIETLVGNIESCTEQDPKLPNRYGIMASCRNIRRQVWATQPIVYRRPSLWKRVQYCMGLAISKVIIWCGSFWHWLGRNADALCYAAIILFSVYMALAIANAARSGMLPAPW